MNNQYIMINIQNWSPWQQPLSSLKIKEQQNNLLSIAEYPINKVY